MNKKILSLILGTMFVTGVGYAAPAAAVEKEQTAVGYEHYDLNHDEKADNFYIEHGLSEKFTVGLAQNDYSGNQDFKTTDITAKYKLNENVNLIVGDRSYSDTSFSNKLLYGVDASVNLAPKVDGYAAYTGTSVSNEWQAGILYKLNDQTSLQLGYKAYKDDLSPTFDGIGFGLRHTF